MSTETFPVYIIYRCKPAFYWDLLPVLILTIHAIWPCLARITGKYGLTQDHIPWRMNGSDFGILPPNLTDLLLTTRAEKHNCRPKKALLVDDG